MLATSLALVALAMPIPHVFHQHASSMPDTRVELTLQNAGIGFRDLSIDGHTYTVLPGHTLNVVAPAGTRILSDDAMRGRHRGDLVLEVTPATHGVVKLN